MIADALQRVRDEISSWRDDYAIDRIGPHELARITEWIGDLDAVLATVREPQEIGIPAVRAIYNIPTDPNATASVVVPADGRAAEPPKESRYCQKCRQPLHLEDEECWNCANPVGAVEEARAPHEPPDSFMAQKMSGEWIRCVEASRPAPPKEERMSEWDDFRDMGVSTPTQSAPVEARAPQEPPAHELMIMQQMHILVAETRRCIVDGYINQAHRKLDALDNLIREAQEARPAPPLDTTFETLRGEVVRLRDIFAMVSQEPGRAAGRRAGTGGWWELSGYADILSDALKRIHHHRKRVEGIDRRVAREAALPSSPAAHAAPTE